MSLIGFQRALAAMIADPMLTEAVRSGHAASLAGFDLTARERRRLGGMAGQPGMRTNCTLYRANRITPLFRLLPLTVKALGPELRRVVDGFWRACPHTSLQFAEEVALFGGYVRGLLTHGALANPLLPDVLDFELARCELSYRPPEDGGAPLRAVRFRHDPELVLGLAAAGSVLSADAEAGEFWLLLDGRGPEVTVMRLDPEVGRRLAML